VAEPKGGMGKDCGTPRLFPRPWGGAILSHPACLVPGVFQIQIYIFLSSSSFLCTHDVHDNSSE